ncbi:MAG: hypothetical protein L0241_22280 [Planctomycetia bacterium]|nr:hypothetical protein [Planctomycetia bacterium]
MIFMGGLSVVLAVGVVVWFATRAGRPNGQGLPDALALSGAQTLSPDETFSLKFPAPAEWVEEPLTITRGKERVDSSIRIFRGRNEQDGFDYAVRVVNLKEDRLFAGSEKDAEQATTELAGLVLGGQSEKAEPMTTNNYPGVQIVVRAPSRGVTYVLRGVAVEDRAYVMFVRGPGVSPDLPQVKEFFDSFRHATVPPPSTDYRPPEGEAFRPLATIPGFYWAAFSPKGDYLYTDCPSFDWWQRRFQSDRLATGVLAQYEVPSFRLVAAFPLKDSGYVHHLDWKNQRLYLSCMSAATGEPARYWISRYDIADLKQNPLEKLHVNPPASIFEYGPEQNKRGGEFVLSGDGRYLFLLSGDFSLSIAGGKRNPGNAVLFRIDVNTMKIDREMNVPLATGGLAASPDGKSVYVIANRQESSCSVWDIDPDTWQLHRELKPHASRVRPHRLFHSRCALPEWDPVSRIWRIDPACASVGPHN